MRSKKPKIKTNMFGNTVMSYTSGMYKISNTVDDPEHWVVTNIETRKHHSINSTLRYILSAYPMD